MAMEPMAKELDLRVNDKILIIVSSWFVMTELEQ